MTPGTGQFRHMDHDLNIIGKGLLDITLHTRHLSSMSFVFGKGYF